MVWLRRILILDKVENKNLGWCYDSYLEREVNAWIAVTEENKDERRN